MERDNAHKIIAITVWNKRISPVFDSAQTLLVVEVEGGEIIHTEYMRIPAGAPRKILRMLQKLKVEVILCGAISEEPANSLEEKGFQLIPFISGEVEKVITSYLQGNCNWTKFTMPGCRGRRRADRNTPCKQSRCRPGHKDKNHEEVQSVSCRKRLQPHLLSNDMEATE